MAGHRMAGLDERMRASQAHLRNVGVRCLLEHLGEDAVEVERRQTRGPCDRLERQGSIRLAVNEFASALEAAEELFARAGFRCGHARDLCANVLVEREQAIREQQEIFFEAARLQLGAAALRQRLQTADDHAARIEVQARDRRERADGVLEKLFAGGSIAAFVVLMGSVGEAIWLVMR